MAHSNEHADSDFHPNPGLERIIFFSDAVMAIAVTLLAVDIKPPDVGPSQLAAALVELSPKFVSFALSFMIIASFWVMHHMTFSYIRDYDYRLAWLNILFLMFIALTPFASSLLGAYIFNDSALMLYSFVIAMAGFTRASIWEYAVREHRFVDSSLSKDLIRKVRVRNMLAPIAFGVSIPLVLINTAFIGIWVVVPISILLFRKLPKGPH
jgi:uncharacterized membrane protein